MRCILIENMGPQSHLFFGDRPLPRCSEDELLVKVKATSLNRADLLQRQGKYPPPPGASEILGLEIAGEIVSLGNKVKRFKIGDRVYGLVAGGGYAEYCCLHQSLAAKIPNNWEFTFAAAIPEALVTAHATLFLIGKLDKNQVFLIHAASSGIASFAIQMAKQKGATVFTTASSEEKIKKATMLLGANKIINYKTEDFLEAIGSHSIDLIVDFIGGDYFPKHLALLKPQGKLVQIATMQGNHVDFNLTQLIKKRLEIYGFVLRSQSLPEKAALWKSAQQQWSSFLVNNSITPIIDSEFDWSQIEAAHCRLLNNNHFGKIVIRID